jgi:hypothetical protein
MDAETLKFASAIYLVTLELAEFMRFSEMRGGP